jgi:hypothetical protein
MRFQTSLNACIADTGCSRPVDYRASSSAKVLATAARTGGKWPANSIAMFLKACAVLDFMIASLVILSGERHDIGGDLVTFRCPAVQLGIVAALDCVR